MRQTCDQSPCMNAAVAYVADYVDDEPVSRFVCLLHAPADVQVRQ